MCAHYEGLNDPRVFLDEFQVEPPAAGSVKADVWPGYASAFIRRPLLADVGDEAVPEREALPGKFGLVPHWAKDLKSSRSTYNARTETVAEKPSFRDAWRRGQFCIIPAQAIYEPDWRTGKAVSTRITRVDGKPMGIAGLWAWWKGVVDKAGTVEEVLSFTMLTVNADQRPFMRNFHKPQDEKRMVVVLPEDSYASWLTVKPKDAMGFMRVYRGDGLEAA